MRARYIGDPRRDGEGPQAVTACGLSFVKGEWRPIPQAAAGRLSGNNHFETDADHDGAADPTVEELRAELEARGIKYHHKAGVEKLKALLA